MSTGAIHCVSYSSPSSSGIYALSGGADRKIVLWNPTTGGLIQSYAGHGHEVLSIACAGDNTLFASAGGDRAVFVWDVATAQTVRRLDGHWARVNAVAFGGEGLAAVLVSGSYDATVKLWDLRARRGAPMQSLDDARDSVSDVAVHGHEIVAASVDGRVRSYDVRMGRCVVDVVSGAGVTGVCVARDGAAMLSAALDGALRLMDRHSGACLQSYRGHRNREMRLGCAFAQADEFVVCGSEAGGELWVWDLLSAVPVVAGGLKCHAGRVVTCVQYCPVVGRRQMLTGGADGTVVVWGEE